ncbi:hypothetical protein [Prevotella sp. P6B4]|uniref:hypothetical protein n=1 Tax=Prevotella sp. P6B4 TaxID=1410614 RepID=UPI00048E4A76|nr:hypothetical protein [Prevotella sp. P6B4]
MKKILSLILMFFVLTAHADEAVRLYEVSGKYYDNQKYDSAVIVGIVLLLVAIAIVVRQTRL